MPGPTGDQARVQASVPAGPFVSGKLGALLARKEYERVRFETRGVESSEDFADLAIHVGDFGKVFAKILAGSGRIGDVRRQFYFGSRILRRVAHHPGDVRFDEADHETKWLVNFARDELAHFLERMRFGWPVHTIPIEPRNVFERKTRFWKDIHFAGDAGAITASGEVSGQAASRGSAGGVVPGTSIAKRVLAGVELRAAGLTD